MKVLVSSFGSAGDVKPFLAMAAALRDAGHEVVCVFDPTWCDQAQAYGLQTRPYGSDWDPSEIASKPEWTDQKRGSVRMLQDLVIPRTGELVRVAREVATDFRPDVILGHHISFGLPWLADELDIPWVMGAMAPAAWPSLDDPNLYPGMPDRERYPRWTIKLGTLCAGFMIDRAIDPQINAIRRSMGLPKQRRTMMREQFSRVLNLGLWSETFRGAAADDPVASRIIGFPVEKRSDEPLDERIVAALDEASSRRHPVAVWSLGSTAVHVDSAQRDRFIRITHERGIAPIVLCGTDSAARKLETRFGVCAVPYAPHESLFGRVDIVVHHAGIGTTAAALRAGVPSIAIPFTHDQPDIARRLRRLGLGAAIARKSQAPDRIDAALHKAIEIVQDRSVVQNAQTLASVIRNEDWEGKLVSAIESVC